MSFASRLQLLASTAILGLAPLLVVAMVIWRTSEQLTDSTAKEYTAVAAEIADKIDRNLFERYSDAQAFGLNSAVQERANWFQGSDSKIVTAMNQYVSLFGFYYLTLLVDANGKLIAVNSKNEDGQPIRTAPLYAMNFGKTNWFAKTTAGEFLKSKDGSLTGTYVEDAVFDETVAQVFANDGLSLKFAAPVMDSDGKTIAIWCNIAKFSIAEQIVRDAYDSLKRRGLDSTDITLLDASGNVLIEYDPQNRNSSELIHDRKVIGLRNLIRQGNIAAQKAAQGESGSLPHWRHSGKQLDQVVGFAPSRGAMGFPGLGWITIVGVNREQALAVVQSAIWSLTWTCAIVLILVAASASSALRRQHYLASEVAKRIRAEESLSKGQEHLRSLLEGLPQLVWTCMPDGRCDYLSKQWLEYTGVPEAQQLGYGWSEAVHPDDRSILLQKWRQSVDEDRPFDVEFRIRKNTGEYRWFKTRAVKTELSDGEKWFGTNTDIHDQKVVEDELVRLNSVLEERVIERTAQLRESERRFQAIFHAQFQFIGLMTTDGTLIEANQTALKAAGLSAESVLGKLFWETQWWTHDAAQQDRLREAVKRVANGKQDRFEAFHIAADGTTIWVDFSLTPFLADDGKVAFLIPEGHDITDRKRAEAALAKSELEAHAATRAKSEFLANMSHEIRTPLTAILGFTDILLQDGDIRKAPSNRLADLEIIKRNGEHLLCIINDILDLSKIESGKLEVHRAPFPLSTFVAETLELMEIRARTKGVALQLRFLTRVPKVIDSDQIRLRQILVNLVGNAIKFTSEGKVEVGVDFLSDAPSGPAVRFAVADTGIGMTPEQMTRLFQPFMQADSSTTRQFGGTGLGLSISKRLAELLGGSIDVSSRPGEGSTFTLTIAVSESERSNFELPAPTSTPAGRPNEDSNEPPRKEIALKGCRVLLAEDSPDNQRLISFHVRRIGCVVQIVGDGQSAIDTVEAAERIGEGFDVILMDMQMPVLDGYSATRQLRANGYRRPIVALTAHAMSGDMEKCIEAGCNAYATKPIDKDKLVQTIADQIRVSS